MSTRFSVAPASSLRMAFEQDKHTALVQHRRGHERIAELMAEMNPKKLYDWIEDLRMPVSSLPAWEHATGGSSVIRFLASRGNHLVIDVPRGKGLQACDVQGLQRITHDAIGALIGFSEGRVDAEETMAALLHAMGALAWQRENVRKANQPELDLEVTA